MSRHTICVAACHADPARSTSMGDVSGGGDGQGGISGGSCGGRSGDGGPGKDATSEGDIGEGGSCKSPLLPGSGNVGGSTDPTQLLSMSCCLAIVGMTPVD